MHQLLCWPHIQQHLYSCTYITTRRKIIVWFHRLEGGRREGEGREGERREGGGERGGGGGGGGEEGV